MAQRTDMGINFESALGPQPQALAVRAARMSVLAGNLANANTPGYLARDIDFKSAMASTRSTLALSTTTPGHIAGSHDGVAPLQYRIPDQPAVDGNTVEADHEMTLFAENSVQFDTAFTLLNRRFGTLLTALRGE